MSLTLVSWALGKYVSNSQLIVCLCLQAHSGGSSISDMIIFASRVASEVKPNIRSLG